MTGAGPFSVHQRTSVARRVEELRYAFADDIHLIHAVTPASMPAAGGTSADRSTASISPTQARWLSRCTPIPAGHVSSPRTSRTPAELL
jgi:hypothetical protein